MSFVRKHVTAVVPRHVRVGLDLRAGDGSGSLDHAREPTRRDPRSLTKTKGEVALSPTRANAQAFAVNALRGTSRGAMRESG
jgi:hypothetical protein